MTTQELADGGQGSMFDRIASRYDLLNRVLSLGLDHRWRRTLLESLEITPGNHVLDLATGTADVAILAAQHYPQSTLVGVDPSQKMLDIGVQKIRDQRVSDRVRLQVGTAEHLPFDNGSFDACCIAFGIRNVKDRPQGLREMRRILKVGGRVGILELSEPHAAWWAWPARFHVHTVVPFLGALLSGSKEYRYLQQSIAAFPAPGAFASMLTDTGFANIKVKPVLFGVANIYSAKAQ